VRTLTPRFLAWLNKRQITLDAIALIGGVLFWLFNSRYPAYSPFI
jgi:hypothetical protein